jgi:major membrane immunogen (membrane-anchored lipoprotein)
MKKFLFLASLCILAVAVCSSASKGGKKYKDGTYVGESRSIYVQEPFYGETTVTIKNDEIVAVQFRIVDRQNNEVFDEKYEKHYAGNEEYIQQCRNDWKGVQTYPMLLAQKKDMSKVDAISGATWSYNIFKASLEEALKKATIKK